jgi:hypothetical protein
MTDLSTPIGSDPQPPTTEPMPPEPAPAPVPPANDFDTVIPQGVHPRDASVPVIPGMPMQGPDKVAGEGNLANQGQRTRAPWSTENEQAFPVYQRASHDWSANQYILASSSGPIQIAGRLRGVASTVIWVPTAASEGVVISPTEGDIQQGAGVTLSPGDSIELPTEAAVWAGVIVGQTTGTVYVARFYNPPGGGLGLSSA